MLRFRRAYNDTCFEKGGYIVREMVHVRVFELKGCEYYMVGTDITLEQYLSNELDAGYMLSDLLSYDLERIRVSTGYAPEKVKAYISERLGLSDVELKESV